MVTCSELFLRTNAGQVVIAVEMLKRCKWLRIPQTSAVLIQSRSQISPQKSSHLMVHYLLCVILRLTMFSTSHLS